ncbi:MAG: IS4 family transposase [Chloroflexota bacterium]
MQTTIPQLSVILQKLLIHDANEIGRQCGFIQRQRKLSGSSFAQGMLFGWLANPNASLEELCQSLQVCGVRISPQGLQERLNSPQAATFLRQLLFKGLSYLVQRTSPRNDLLEQFSGVFIQDSSQINLPDCLNSIWPSASKGESTLKIQTVLDYQNGTIDLTLASGRDHDCPLQTTNLPHGSLRLADLGYFKVPIFKQLSSAGVYWVSRVPARAGIWLDGSVTHIATWLKQWKCQVVDTEIELTAQRLYCRIIAVPAPSEVAQERRRRVRKAARKRKNSRLKSETLELCDWTILITNLPEERYAVEDILCLQRLRWQIELLFKLWKTTLSLDAWRSEKPNQILTEVYAKLLVALIQHWLLLLGCWQNANRSLVKASLALRKHAFQLSANLPYLKYLRRSLKFILSTLDRCVVQKRKSRPATFQLLGRDFP